MVESGIGYAITLDRLVSTAEGSALCFRAAEAQTGIRAQYRLEEIPVFSPAAELFLERLKSREFSGS